MSTTTAASKKRCAREELEKDAENGEDIKQSVKTVRKRKKKLPIFSLKGNGERASLATATSERVPLTLTDVQHLLLHSRLGNFNLTECPHWYVLYKCGDIKKTTCLVLEGISVKEWEQYADEFNETKEIFTNSVEILTPSVYGGSLVEELALVPLSEAEKDTIIQQYGSINLALEARKDLMIMMKAVFPIGDTIINEVSNSSEDKFPRTQLVLSAWQLIKERYPVPLKGKLRAKYAHYVFTKDQYAPVTVTSPMFGVDCEMCLTSAGSELTRISVVNEKHEVIYESLVKPDNNIKDYLTRFSGITESLLSNVSKRLQDVQNDLRAILPPDAILVGQSLNIDLHALKMMHPYIIDTSLQYNFTKERNRKPKLKTLAKEFLKEDIQMGEEGHCPTEDSLAALKLVQLKLSNSIEFGDSVHTTRKFDNSNKTSHYSLPIVNEMQEQKKSSIIIGCDDITGDYHTYLSQAKESMSEQLIKGNPNEIKLITVDSVEKAITSFTDSVTHYNLIMAHLKLDMCNDQKVVLINKINMWIKSLWDSLVPSSLFVIVFGGTSNDNGLALVKVKMT